MYIKLSIVITILNFCYFETGPARNPGFAHVIGLEYFCPYRIGRWFIAELHPVYWRGEVGGEGAL